MRVSRRGGMCRPIAEPPDGCRDTGETLAGATLEDLMDDVGSTYGTE